MQLNTGYSAHLRYNDCPPLLQLKNLGEDAEYVREGLRRIRMTLGLSNNKTNVPGKTRQPRHRPGAKVLDSDRITSGQNLS